MNGVTCTCMFGPTINAEGQTVHTEHCAVTHPVRHASWQAVLALVDGLPRETGGTSRSISDFIEDGSGGSTTQATFEVDQPDGSSKVYAITVGVQETRSHGDAFWGPGGRRDADDPQKRVVVDGEHYVLGDDNADYPSAYKGFGGRRFHIEFFDGRKVTTRDLWHQGVIPPKWRERYPDNARFMTADAPTKAVADA